MDNRELANSELSKVLDSGVVSIRNTKLNSINELPPSETLDPDTSSGNSINTIMLLLTYLETQIHKNHKQNQKI